MNSNFSKEAKTFIVKELQACKMTDEEIIQSLQKQGYSEEDIKYEIFCTRQDIDDGKYADKKQFIIMAVLGAFLSVGGLISIFSTSSPIMRFGLLIGGFSMMIKGIANITR